jgi:hypothetical protein
MELPGERQLLADLLKTNQQLVAVNQSIAQSLSNLEQLYAEELHRNEEQRQKTEAQMAKFTNPMSQWRMWLPLVVIILFGALLPMILRLLQK